MSSAQGSAGTGVMSIIRGEWVRGGRLHDSAHCDTPSLRLTSIPASIDASCRKIGGAVPPTRKADFRQRIPVLPYLRAEH